MLSFTEEEQKSSCSQFWLPVLTLLYFPVTSPPHGLTKDSCLKWLCDIGKTTWGNMIQQICDTIEHELLQQKLYEKKTN